MLSLQIAYAIEAAMSEGFLFKPSKGNEQGLGGEFADETTADDASNAVLIASSVLASYLADSPYKVTNLTRPSISSVLAMLFNDP